MRMVKKMSCAGRGGVGVYRRRAAGGRVEAREVRWMG